MLITFPVKFSLQFADFSLNFGSFIGKKFRTFFKCNKLSSSAIGPNLGSARISEKEVKESVAPGSRLPFEEDSTLGAKVVYAA